MKMDSCEIPFQYLPHLVISHERRNLLISRAVRLTAYRLDQ